MNSGLRSDSERKKAIEDKKDFTDLISSKGWRKLREILNAQVRERSNQILLVPLGELQGVYQQEFMKGETAAYMAMVTLPEILLDEATEVAKALEMENEANGRQSNDDAADE